MISERMPVFPGDPPPAIRRHDLGRYLLTELLITTHTGTHIDAPAHYLRDGRTIDLVPLHALVGDCRVVGVGEGKTAIEWQDIAARAGGAERLLLKTGASLRNTFDREFPHLTLSAAEALVEQGCICVGIDSPSIEALEGDGGIHRLLLDNDIVVIEFLDLSGITEGEYLMCALPLKVESGDGAPARVILMEG